ncbi:AmpG family muropeptide MFS transporter [Mangrovitalea sediminis]|uniref:AmpG family muropeptide MFS transporter n=1 Tax=Mangrovitalea sediminis TaxID=1982043 RepID=UPI001D0D50D2
MASSPETATNWREALQVYLHWPVLALLFLGFSSGLPYLLVFSTLTARLADVGINTTTIGFFSWLGITYSIKVLWAPVVDQLRLPILYRLFGQRRSWLLLAQAGIATGLWAMAHVSAHTDTSMLALWGLLVAFSSATQDVVIDALRIESAEARLQAAMSAAYVFGYRVALLVAGAGALYLAQFWSWTFAYQCMAALVGVGVITALLIPEPAINHRRLTEDLEKALEVRMAGRGRVPKRWVRIQAWVSTVVMGPFIDFVTRYRRFAVTLLALVALYRVCDISMGVMANPFYLKFLGFSKAEVASVTKIFGFFMTILGSLVGGSLVMKFGVRKILLLGAILAAANHLLFVVVAMLPPNLVTLAFAVSVENLSSGIAIVAFIAWLSSMTNAAFTATQYALFSSLMTLPGKFIGGFSGWLVAEYGYAGFFFISSLLGIPAILLAWRVLYIGPSLDRLVASHGEMSPAEQLPRAPSRNGAG